jgi:hypothetical protein
MSNKAVRELAKDDPDFHDIRAKILLEAAQHMERYAKEAPYGAVSERLFAAGLQEAAAELRRMASNARRAHKKLQDERRTVAQAGNAKVKTFVYRD